MPEKLTVLLGDRSYPIIIDGGNLHQFGASLASVGFPSRVALVSNTTVHALYGKDVEKSLETDGFEVLTHVIPDGEIFKNTETVNSIYDFLIRGNFDRTSGLVALGGGVVGDIAGFAAATFLRGIPYAQVPTTLLAQVDSSVGGKTGVNHSLGKNLIGSFYQPQLVFIDVETLKTLPCREFSAGMAEVIKYGMIWDEEYFDWLKGHRNELMRLDADVLIWTIKRACQIKAEIVEKDEKETDIRAILNYGHTFGHAVENLAGYGEYRHGEGVAIGMHIAALASRKMNLCSDDDLEELKKLLLNFHLPISLPPFPLEEYWAIIKRDKKNREGVLRLVLNKGIGGFQILGVPDPKAFFMPLFESTEVYRIQK